jgi:hypothetical protein
VPESSPSDEAEVILTTAFAPLHTTHRLAKGDHLSLLSLCRLSTFRHNCLAMPEAPNISRGHLALLCLILDHGQLVSTSSPAVYAPQNTSRHFLPPGNTCDPHGASGNMGSHQGGIKGSTFSRSSQYLSAYRSSFQAFSPLTVQVSLNLRGTPSLLLNSYLVSCTLHPCPHSQRQATPSTFAHSSVSHLPHLH